MSYSNRLNNIPGIRLPEDAINRQPPILLSQITEPDVLQQFLGVMDWLVATLRATERSI